MFGYLWNVHYENGSIYADCQEHQSFTVKRQRFLPTQHVRGRGRPRKFNRSSALESAMLLFWERGYDETSLTDLQRVMRLSPSSLYAAFGSKQRLYQEALEFYLASSGSFLRETLALALPVQAILRTILESAAREMTRRGRPAGCMLSLAVVQGGPRTVKLRKAIATLRHTSRALIRARLRRAMRNTELPRATDAAALARFFMTILQGMSVQARDGATHRQLLSVAASAMKVFGNPALV